MALNVKACCYGLRSDCGAQLPGQVYQETGQGVQTLAEGGQLRKVLNLKTNTQEEMMFYRAPPYNAASRCGCLQP